MLIDFFGKADFNNKPVSDFLFSDLPYYKEWNHPKREFSTGFSSVTSVYKKVMDAEIYSSESLQVQIFGYCFPRSTSDYLKSKKRLTAAEVAGLYQQKGLKLTDEIKGSFTILVVDIQHRHIHLISDPLNIRQVYYHRTAQLTTFSTSLNALIHNLHSLNQKVAVNEKSLINYYLFDYILDDSTFIEGINVLPAGSILTVEDGALSINSYFDPFIALNPKQVFSEQESLELLEKVLNYNMDLYLDGADDAAVALTGGYDSRMNLAILSDQAQEYQYYSYGKKGSYDIEIPTAISKSLNLSYHPYYINGEYESGYHDFADQAVYWSDGIADITKANFVFPFSKLARETDHILTGLFGSELIKQPTSNGLFMDINTRKLLLSSNLSSDLDEIFADAYQQEYLNNELLNDWEREISQDVLNNPYFNNDLPVPLKFFYFILMQGSRKYFMKEIKIERPYIENLHPFFDLEFIQTLIKTPYAWVNNFSQGKNLLKSLQNHRFYTKLISKNNPALGSIISTHAYYPKYLNSVFTYPLLALQYKYYKKKFYRTNKKTFDHGHLYRRYYDLNQKYFNQYNNLFNQDAIESAFNEDLKNANRFTGLQKWFQLNRIQIN